LNWIYIATHLCSLAGESFALNWRVLTKYDTPFLLTPWAQFSTLVH
jgi:hypothetical protein